VQGLPTSRPIPATANPDLCGRLARIYSPDRAVTLTMQPDGNLVEYVGKTPAWSRDTHIPESILIAQSDGNLVIVAPDNRPVWETGTPGLEWCISSRTTAPSAAMR
jgi:hypothetical protein